MFVVLKNSARYGGALVLALAVLAGTATAQQPAEKQQMECVATLQPTNASAQADPVVLRAVYSASIGEVLSAKIDEASGIKVIEVRSAQSSPGSAPGSSVELDLSNAVAGEWTVSFQGEGGLCSGTLVVKAASDPSL
jgi:hypothetical protein